MGGLSPTVVDPLTTDQWVLGLPTAVTLATPSLEGPTQESVNWVVIGMDQLQLVKVCL